MDYSAILEQFDSRIEALNRVNEELSVLHDNIHYAINKFKDEIDRMESIRR